MLAQAFFVHPRIVVTPDFQNSHLAIFDKNINTMKAISKFKEITQNSKRKKKLKTQGKNSMPRRPCPLPPSQVMLNKSLNYSPCLSLNILNESECWWPKNWPTMMSEYLLTKSR